MNILSLIQDTQDASFMQLLHSPHHCDFSESKYGQ